MSRKIEALAIIDLRPGQSVNATLHGPIVVKCGDGKFDKNTQLIQNGNIVMPYNSLMVNQPLNVPNISLTHDVNITCQSKS